MAAYRSASSEGRAGVEHWQRFTLLSGLEHFIRALIQTAYARTYRALRRQHQNRKGILLLSQLREECVNAHPRQAIKGHVVATAPDGAEGLNVASAFRPEMVLCDIGLDGLGGYAVARALRDKPDGLVLYLVALTGYAQPEDVARARSAGFDAHLPKPPNLNVPKRMIQDYGRALEEALAIATLQPGAQ